MMETAPHFGSLSRTEIESLLNPANEDDCTETGDLSSVMGSFWEHVERGSESDKELGGSSTVLSTSQHLGTLARSSTVLK